MLICPATREKRAGRACSVLLIDACRFGVGAGDLAIGLVGGGVSGRVSPARCARCECLALKILPYMRDSLTNAVFLLKLSTKPGRFSTHG